MRKNKKTPEEAAFTRDQLLAFDRYLRRRDLLGVLLENGRRYTFSEADARLEEFMKGRVR